MRSSSKLVISAGPDRPASEIIDLPADTENQARQLLCPQLQSNTVRHHQHQHQAQHQPLPERFLHDIPHSESPAQYLTVTTLLSHLKYDEPNTLIFYWKTFKTPLNHVLFYIINECNKKQTV